MTTEEKYRLANQLVDTAAELARLGAMCCSNDPRTELERMAAERVAAERTALSPRELKIQKMLGNRKALYANPPFFGGEKSKKEAENDGTGRIEDAAQ